MASGVTRISDLIVPAVFSRYMQVYTQQKIRLIRSGAMVLNPLLSADLAGGGLTFNRPSFRDLDDDAENTSTDDPTTLSTPQKIGTLQEIQVRMNRNQSWSSMDLAAQLAGEDPVQAITNLVSDYWARRWQGAFIAQMAGIFANNATATDAYHTQNDMTMSIAGASYVDGVTNFSAEAFIDATLTMGDSLESLTMVCMHSLVYGRALKNNLIDFVSDSVNGQAIRIPTFLGRMVIVDDAMPFTGGVFETWLFGAGSLQYGEARLRFRLKPIASLRLVTDPVRTSCTLASSSVSIRSAMPTWALLLQVARATQPRPTIWPTPRRGAVCSRNASRSRSHVC